MLDAIQRAGARVRQAPTPPAPPPPPPEVPDSRDELDALAAKRGELVNQLEAMTDRREELTDQLSETPPPARAGLEERIAILDDRSARLEREIHLTEDAIAAGIAAGLGSPQGTGTTEEPDQPRFSEEAVNIMIGEALGFVLLGILLYRWTWRRARAHFSRGTPDDGGRMDQLQNAVDAIAVEIERISEGQRYVTKVLNEGSQPMAIERREDEEVLARRKAP